VRGAQHLAGAAVVAPPAQERTARAGVEQRKGSSVFVPKRSFLRASRPRVRKFPEPRGPMRIRPETCYRRG